MIDCSQHPREARMPERERQKLGRSKIIFRETFDLTFFVYLEELQQELIALNRNEESIKIVRRSFWFKFRFIYRPLQILSGVLLILIALLIFVSLLLSNINKCIHFTSFKQIFAQGNKTLPNPIDIIVTWTGRVSDNFN